MTTSAWLRPPGALIVTPWYGGTRGGVAVAVESLVQGLIRAGGRAITMRLVPDGWIPRTRYGTADEEIVELCVRPHAAAVGTPSQRAGYYMRFEIAQHALRRIVREQDVRVVHFSYAIEQYPVLARLAREMGLKVVTTFHGSDVNNTLEDPATRYMVEELVAASDHITAVSRTLADRLKAAIPEIAPRLTVLHNGVPTAFAAAADGPRATDALTTRWEVLLAGQLTPRKGGDVLLDALALVREEIPTVHAAFAGSGRFESELRAHVVRLGLGANVEFLGNLSRENLSAAYRATKVLVIPSRSEGLPLVLLEALWLGVPVVATAVDGLPEVVRDDVNGLLVPPDDAPALADALRRILLDTGLRQRLSGQARASIADHFSPEATTEKYAEVYRMVLAGS